LVNTTIGGKRYDRCMSSDLPPGAFPADRGQHWGPPPISATAPTASSPTAPPRTFGRPPRWPAFIALPIALIALAVAIVGWFRPTSHNNQPPSKPTYTDQQVASAKTDVCTAFEQVTHGIALADAQSASSSDATAKVAAVALTRQALDFGSQYLTAKVAEEPAAPPELASAVQQQAKAFRELLIGYLNGALSSDPSQQPAQKASDEATATIQQLCK
jgi:hypothetical protein